MITVHYPNEATFSYPDFCAYVLFDFTYKFDCKTNLYKKANFPEYRGGYFQVTEISEDKQDVWVEWFKD